MNPTKKHNNMNYNDENNSQKGKGGQKPTESGRKCGKNLEESQARGEGKDGGEGGKGYCLGFISIISFLICLDLC